MNNESCEHRLTIVDLIVGSNDSNTTDDIPTLTTPVVEGGAAVTSVGVAQLDNLLPDKITECSLISPGAHTGVCSSDDAIGTMAQIAGYGKLDTTDVSSMTAAQKQSIVDSTKQKLRCDTELCVLRSDSFRNLYGYKKSMNEIQTNFKVKGPTDTKLLNNINIDETLRQWALKYNSSHNKFYAFGFNMRNFKEYGDSLATVSIRDLYNDGYRTFGCIINTDVYTGRGKHWMALFGDMRGDVWTVEFFNSSGNQPSVEYAEWLVETNRVMQEIISENKLTNISSKIVKCCEVEHQKSKTECGVYSLYYIYARLSGVSYEHFMKNEITDVICFEFRQHLFFDESRPAMGAFDYDTFKGSAQVKWEDGISRAIISRITGSNNKKKTGGDSNNDSADQCVELNYNNIISLITTDMTTTGSDEQLVLRNGISRDQLDELLFTTPEEKAEFDIDVGFSSIVDNTNRTLPHRQITIPLPSLCQRSRMLLLCGIEFMNRYANNISNVLYICEGEPSCIVLMLARLFPRHKFIVYDNESKCQSMKNIEVNQNYFTYEAAREYVSGGVGGTNTLMIVNTISNELNRFADTVGEIKPRAVSLICANDIMLRTYMRLYNTTNTTNTTNTNNNISIFIQPWACPYSTETRLFVEYGIAQTSTINADSYNDALFRHNYITRQYQSFEHDIKSEGICMCYDCTAEVAIVKKYCIGAGTYNEPEIINHAVAKLSRDISTAIGCSLVSVPHGIYTNMQLRERYHILYCKYADVMLAEFNKHRGMHR